MTRMRAAVLRQQVEEGHEAAENEPGTSSHPAEGAPRAVPTAWHNPPAELYYTDDWDEPWWMWEGGKGYWGYDPGWWTGQKGFQAKGGGKGKKGGFNKGGGKGWQGPKGSGKGPKGEQGAKGGKDQAGKGGKGGKGGRGG